MELFFINTRTITLQMFLYTYCYELTITGLLEVKLLSDLLRNGRHLLQQLRILLVCTVGGYPASDYIHGAPSGSRTS
jgi:hypothetical protein